MDLEDVSFRLDVRKAVGVKERSILINVWNAASLLRYSRELNLAIDATWSDQSRVERFNAIRGHYNLNVSP